MLELPEVEILRREVEREFGGKKVKALAVHSASVVEGGATKAQLASYEAAKITSISRRGLHLALVTNGTDGLQAIVFDVGNGVALRKGAQSDVAVELSVTQGGPLSVMSGPDGSVHLCTGAELDARWPKSAGLDLSEHAVSWQAFARLLVANPGSVRSRLLDAALIDGIGPLYADEILWQAGLRPERRVEAMGSQELRRLYRSTVELFHEAQKAGGATTATNGFTDLSGKPGGFQDQLEVYGRDGKPCRRCRSTVASQKVEGKLCYLCPQCQV